MAKRTSTIRREVEAERLVGVNETPAPGLGATSDENTIECAGDINGQRAVQRFKIPAKRRMTHKLADPKELRETALWGTHIESPR